MFKRVIPVLLLVLAVAACDSNASTSSSTPTPASTPTPQAFTPTAQNGPTVLGASVDNFFGKYGSPSVKKDQGYTWFLFDSNGNRVKWISADDKADGTVTRVNVINASDTAWSLGQSIGECHAFLPADATLTLQIDPNTQRFTSSLGEIQLERQNDQGDCLVFILGT